MTTTDSTIRALTTVLTNWDSLRDLLDTRSPSVWPPADPAEYTAQLDQHDAAEVALTQEREHLVLREVGAPLRLHVLDTMRTVETALLQVADEIASEIQRAAITSSRPSSLDPVQFDIERLAAHDARDPARWRYNRGPRTATAAAQWLRARAHGEAGPCTPLTDDHWQLLNRVASNAARRIEQLLGAERRHDAMPRPCPWCKGPLILHHGGVDEAEFVTCDNGFDCAAPVQVVGGRRAWSTPQQLVQLYAALEAAERRARRAAAKKRQRDASRVGVN
ncbi:hypothetical protein GCM10011583_11660 [Streptomyces camponoticapitis]|uniref:DNA binding protein n=1 Tax=Streptomyces camponoticapitis TaxID=1616125 RepID=A0ABQ2DZE9_9ACTN|nr:hypothetical protein [Streptomyces camponoticapitis]GGJ81860.1 hypothetical protein GCM10011583_11660 [Streptomyces camponoticapitis]